MLWALENRSRFPEDAVREAPPPIRRSTSAWTTADASAPAPPVSPAPVDVACAFAPLLIISPDRVMLWRARIRMSPSLPAMAVSPPMEASTWASISAEACMLPKESPPAESPSARASAPVIAWAIRRTSPSTATWAAVAPSPIRAPTVGALLPAALERLPVARATLVPSVWETVSLTPSARTERSSADTIVPSMEATVAPPAVADTRLIPMEAPLREKDLDSARASLLDRAVTSMLPPAARVTSGATRPVTSASDMAVGTAP